MSSSLRAFHFWPMILANSVTFMSGFSSFICGRMAAVKMKYAVCGFLGAFLSFGLVAAFLSAVAFCSDLWAASLTWWEAWESVFLYSAISRTYSALSASACFWYLAFSSASITFHSAAITVVN